MKSNIFQWKSYGVDEGELRIKSLSPESQYVHGVKVLYEENGYALWAKQIKEHLMLKCFLELSGIEKQVTVTAAVVGEVDKNVDA